MAIQGFFTGDVKIKNLNGVLKAVDGVVEVATDAGTVTSVGIQVGSTGTDVNIANSPVTTSGNITLNLPTASATNRGLLSSADWAIFSAKQGAITLTTTGNNGSATLTSGTLNIPTYTLAGLGGISLTSLSASSPLAYNNTTGAFSIQVANGSQNGYLSSADWTTFNSKQSALTFSSPLVNTSGTISIPAATSSVNGYLTSTDWVTFNSKQGAITLTTTGSSGAATLIGTTLNIPNYSGALTGYVPYTGATGNVDLGEYGISSGYFQADLTPSGTLQVGRMQWNSTDGTMDLRLMGNNVTLQIGQEQVARVVNGTGVNLLESNYQAVKIIGAQGQRLQVGLARADNDANSKDTLGLVTENINNNQEGFITVSGLVNEINTTGSLQGETWADGDTLYLSGTTSGAITNVKPTAPIHTVIVGFVVYAHANHGKIFVKVDNGYELEELHDVAPTPYVNKGVLYRDTATNLWKSATIGTLLGYTPANAATTLTINGTAYDLSANRTWNVGTVTSIGTSGPLTGGTITGSGTIGITQATTSTDGYLSSTDWNTFNNKQAAGSYITALTGEATATGPGSASVTLSTSAVTGKLLTGLNLTGGGSIAATDSILQAFGKVQNQISGLAGGVTYQGTWNASTNTPTLTSSVGTKGYYYIVDVAGSTNLNGITDWKIGDWAIFNGSTWDKVDNTDAVSSVNGFTGAVSLTTSNIAEGTNLYYLDSRARLALSFTAGSGAYDNTTGVITIPTNTSQLTNGANFITLSSLSASSPLSYNNVSGAFSIQVANGSQNGYLSSSDWTTFNNKQAALTLTTTGSSGSSTLVGATLNVPTYTLSGLGGVPTSRTLTINGTSYDLSSDRTWSVGTITGTGTSNYLPKWQSSSALGDSLVYDASTAVLIGTTTASTAKFMVYSATADNHYQAIGSAPSFRFADTITSPTYTGIIGLATASNHFIVGAAAGDMVLANNTTSSLGNFIFGTGTTERMRITPTGNVSINNTNNTYRFDVNGTVRFTGQLRLESTITNGTYTYTLPGATGTLALVGGAGVGTVTSVATTGPITGGTITSTGTIGITQATSSTDGYLSSTDWTTFNNKQNALTNPVTGTGTTNYLPKFTGTSTIGNSQIFDNGTNVGIGTATPSGKLTINSTGDNNIRLENGSELAIVRVLTSGALDIWSHGDTANEIQFRQGTGSGSVKMMLDASGNLGLGVTPQSWWSSRKAIEIFNGGAFTGVNAGWVEAWGNSYLDAAAATSRYLQNGFASLYQLGNTASGGHIWFTAPSGTAGNAISFTQAMTLNASGNLSIGNTNDTYKLDVSGTGRFTGNVELTQAANPQLNLIGTNSTGVEEIYFKRSTSTIVGYIGAGINSTFNNVGDVFAFENRLVTGSIILRTNSINALTIASTGAATFSDEVRAGSWIATANNRGFTIRNAANTAYRTAVQMNSSNVLIFGQDSDISALTLGVGSEAMRINSSGNVGIGTTSPTGRLMLYQSTAGNVFQNIVSNQGGSTQVGINLSPSMTDGEVAANPAQASIYATDSNYGANIIFANKTTGAVGNSLTERMRITSGGSVGIGTTSPTFADGMGLHINNSTGAARLRLTNNTTGGTATDGSEFTIAGSDLYVINNEAGNMFFYTNASERMRITSGGNVGIGTTSPGRKLDVNGVTRSNAFDIYYNSVTSGFLLTETQWTGVAGANNVSLVAEGGVTGGGNITFFTNGSATERMRITSGGNVGIGTTSPSERLEVNGSLRLSDGNADGPQLKLASSGYSDWNIDNFSGNLRAYYGSTEYLRLTSGGQLQIRQGATGFSDGLGIINPSLNIWTLVNGGDNNLYFGFNYGASSVITPAGNYIVLSDINKKKDFEKSTIGLSAILGLKPTLFRMKNDNESVDKQLGFIAQEVAEVIPQAYSETGEFVGLNYNPIVAALTKAVQELKAELDTLKNK